MPAPHPFLPGRIPPHAVAVPLGQAAPATLPARLRAAADDPATRVLLLHDLGAVDPAPGRATPPGVEASAEDRRRSLDAVRDHAGALAALAQTLPRLPFPVIGVATGSVGPTGCLLAAGCDLVLAAHDARFGLAPTAPGIPAAVQLVAVAAAVGHRHARALATRPGAVDARRALELGLVTDLVPAAGLPDAVAALVAELAAADPRTVAAGRTALPPRTPDPEQLLTAVEAVVCAHEPALAAGARWPGTPVPRGVG